mgnify:CR=1 FL=1
MEKEKATQKTVWLLRPKEQAITRESLDMLRSEETADTL